VDYSQDPLYPTVSGVDGSGFKTYFYPATPTTSALDLMPPSFIDSFEVSRVPDTLRLAMIAASYLAIRPEANTGQWLVGAVGISQLRVQSVIP
jgi:hypothetical protein